VSDVTSRPRADMIEIAEGDEQMLRRLRDRDAQLLRAHGRSEEATNFTKVLESLREIFAAGVGDERLAQALDWVSSEIWALGSSSGISRARH
jgi:G:T/U-mismatch repair DNA glycosylase